MSFLMRVPLAKCGLEAHACNAEAIYQDVRQTLKSIVNAVRGRLGTSLRSTRDLQQGARA